MPFKLTSSESKVLGLPIEQEVTYGAKNPRKHGGRGTPREQKTGVYTDMHNKIDKSFSYLAGYSQYLHLIGLDRSKYAASIISAYSNVENHRTILANILRSDKIPNDRKLELAAMLLAVSGDHIIETMNDELRRETIAEPLKSLMKKLQLIISTNREHQRLLIDNSIMKHRSMRLNRLLESRSELHVYSVTCKVCTQTWRGTTLEDALLGVKHEKDCPYVNDKARVEEERTKYPKDTRPLRPIIEDYIINLPLRRVIVNEGSKDAKEIHLRFMPDDYKQYVMTEQ